MSCFAHDATESQPWNSVSSALGLNLGAGIAVFICNRDIMLMKKNEVNKNSVSGAAKSFACSSLYCRATFCGICAV